MLCVGMQETLCPIPHDLNKVTILLFPFPPHRALLLRPRSLEEMSNVWYHQPQSQPGNTSCACSQCQQARAAAPSSPGVSMAGRGTPTTESLQMNCSCTEVQTQPLFYSVWLLTANILLSLGVLTNANSGTGFAHLGV